MQNLKTNPSGHVKKRNVKTNKFECEICIHLSMSIKGRKCFEKWSFFIIFLCCGKLSSYHGWRFKANSTTTLVSWNAAPIGSWSTAGEGRRLPGSRSNQQARLRSHPLVSQWKTTSTSQLMVRQVGRNGFSTSEETHQGRRGRKATIQDAQRFDRISQGWFLNSIN